MFVDFGYFGLLYNEILDNVHLGLNMLEIPYGGWYVPTSGYTPCIVYTVRSSAGAIVETINKSLFLLMHPKLRVII
jgi:hypothetical protein